MSKSANVLSVQTLKDFKLAMCNFAEEARNSLSGVDMELRRMRDWLERDQLGYWQSQIKKRQEDLMQARADLHKRKISQQGSDAVSDAEQKEALREATRRLRVAEEKLAHGQAVDSAPPPRDRRIPLPFPAAGRPSFGRVREEPVHSGKDDRFAGGVPGAGGPHGPSFGFRCKRPGRRRHRAAHPARGNRRRADIDGRHAVRGERQRQKYGGEPDRHGRDRRAGR